MTKKGIFTPSLLKGFYVTNSEAVSWPEVFNYLVNNSLREQTERYRVTNNPQIKAGMPCITPAVQLNGKGKQETDILGMTGIALADFDDIPIDELPECMAKIRADRHTFMLYLTVSGRGLRILFRYTEMDYSTAFLSGNCYYADLIGHAFDEKCSNPGRLSTLCHDPQASFSPDSEPFTSSHPSPPPPENRFMESPVDFAVRTIQKHGYTYTEGSRNNFLMRCLMLMNKLGVSQSEAENWAVSFDLPQREALSIVKSCYSHTALHGTYELVKNPDTKKGFPTEKKRKRISPQEIAAFLTSVAEFRFNLIADHTEWKWLEEKEWKPLTDRDVSSLWMRMAAQGVMGHENHINSVIQSDFTPLFNPFKVYFESLPPFLPDTDPIAQLAARIHLVNESPALRTRLTECLRKWLVAMVAGIFLPEVVNHEILVFIGEQGNYKSSFFAYLLPPELRRYFYTKLQADQVNKDDLFTLSQYALIAFEEIDCMKPAELNRLKALTTMRDINERRAYGRHKEHKTHLASFCATGNNVQFLNDRSGNRRWLPFEVAAIDSPVEHPFHYDAIYSQVWHLFQSGFQYWFDSEEIKLINEHNARFETPCLEEELISIHYSLPQPGLSSILVNTATILERINGLLKQPLTAQKVGLVMKKAGYPTVRTNRGVNYRVHELSAIEMEAAKHRETAKRVECS